MKKIALFTLFALALMFSVSSAYAWTYDYHTYVLGFGNVDAGYTSTSSSTYEKNAVSVDTPWGSQDHVKISKTSTDSFQPNQPTYVVVDNTNYANNNHDYNDYYDNSYNNHWNNYQNGNYYYGNDNGQYDVNDYYGTYSAYSNVHYRPVLDSNYRYKNSYNYNDYGNDVYGNDYYYQPRVDWHEQVYNWAY